MSNIHGFSDLNSRDNRRLLNNNQQMSDGLPFMRPPEQDPRSETIFDMMKINCCPQFKWTLFSVQVTAYQIALFILSLLIGGIQIGGEFLSPSYEFLSKYINKDVCKIRYDFQVWRLWIAALFHANFNHILFNSIGQLILGCMIEPMVGTNKFIIIYFGSGIGGNLFSALLTDYPSVGASTCIFGLLGAYLAFIFVNWESMNYPGSPRSRMLCFVVTMILFNFMFSAGNNASKLDVMGHVGGLITGTLLGTALINTRENTPYDRKINLAGVVLSAIYFLGAVIIFFTLRNPHC